MSVTIKLDIKDSCIKENVSCHLLPCRIKLNGFCKVSKYFSPYVKETDNVLSASFRGYPLQGQKVEAPSGYTGVILRENTQISSDDKDLKAVGTFNEFTTWNWDKIPSADDKLVKALQWINVASILHEPVSESNAKSSRSPQKQKKRKISE